MLKIAYGILFNLSENFWSIETHNNIKISVQTVNIKNILVLSTYLTY